MTVSVSQSPYSWILLALFSGRLSHLVTEMAFSISRLITLQRFFLKGSSKSCRMASYWFSFCHVSHATPGSPGITELVLLCKMQLPEALCGDSGGRRGLACGAHQSLPCLHAWFSSRLFSNLRFCLLFSIRHKALQILSFWPPSSQIPALPVASVDIRFPCGGIL